MSVKEYEFHPYASILPMLGVTEANELAADIQAHGLREDIVLFEGKILDGRNRYKACKTVNVEPRYVDLNGDGDPIDFIVSKNIKRRHLTQSQKAMVVAKILSLPRGNPNLKSPKTPTNPKSPQNGELGKSATVAAREIGVGHTTVDEAKRVLREAPKETVEQVERGDKSVATAVKEIKAEKQKKEAAKEAYLDKTGYVIPEDLLDDWKRAEAFGSHLRTLSNLKTEIADAIDQKDPVYTRQLNSSVVSMIQNLYGELKCVIPYAVCTSCQGKQKTKCTLCKASGFISKFEYKQFVPAETKELRERMAQK